VATVQFTTVQALTLSTALDLASVPFGVLVKAKRTLDRQEADESSGSSLSPPGPSEASSSEVEDNPPEAPARTGKTKEQMKRTNKHAWVVINFILCCRD